MLKNILQRTLSAGYATKAADAAKSVAVTTGADWKAVKVPAETLKDMPVATGGAAFKGDLRATSGLGLGDGLHSHTAKWLQGKQKSPMQYISEAEPIKVKGTVVASYGSDDPALGCPVEYINLKGTSFDNPAVCKYTGNRYYSEDWMYGH